VLWIARPEVDLFERDSRRTGEEVQPVALNCAGKGVKAEYHAQTQSMPPTVDVSFRGSRPTSQAAERALRTGLQNVADTKFVIAEVPDTVTLPDGSDLEATNCVIPFHGGPSHPCDDAPVHTWV
jgi:hypothetical protein